MNIALVRASYNPFGGAERTIQSVAEALIAGGDACTIVTRHWPENAGQRIAHRVVNPRYVTKAGRENSFARCVGQLIDSHAFDLVQSYERIPGAHIYHAVDGVHAEWLTRRQRAQGALSRLGVSLNPHHRAVLELERGMYASPNLKAVICISKMVKDDIVRRFGFDGAKCEVIHLDIDTEKFRPRVREEFRESTRTRLGIPAGAQVAVFAGSGFVRKGVAAFLQVVQRLPQLHGIVVGHAKAMPKFKSLAANLGVANRVHFTGGVKDVRPYYGAADVFVMPTLYEPFGLVYGEAMAILAGDALLTMAFDLISHPDLMKGCEPSRQIRIIRELAYGSGNLGMVGGQVFDIQAENQDIDLPTLQNIHKHKTGMLIRAAVRMGAIAAGASDRQLDDLTGYAEDIGLAFQIADDVLNVTGTREELGKNPNTDAERGKKTYPTFYGVDGARQLAEDCVTRAIGRLNAFGAAADPLRDIARYITSRKN